MIMWFEKGASHCWAYKERENSIQEFQPLHKCEKIVKIGRVVLLFILYTPLPRLR